MILDRPVESRVYPVLVPIARRLVRGEPDPVDGPVDLLPVGHCPHLDRIGRLPVLEIDRQLPAKSRTDAIRFLHVRPKGVRFLLPLGFPVVFVGSTDTRLLEFSRRLAHLPIDIGRDSVIHARLDLLPDLSDLRTDFADRLTNAGRCAVRRIQRPKVEAHTSVGRRDAT